MADRVKYFLLGLLFLVVAGVIAYDRAYDSWNRDGGGTEARVDQKENQGSAEVGPRANRLIVPPTPEPDPVPVPPPSPNPTPVPPPAPPPAPTPAPPPRPAPERVHLVQSGETLEAIAIRYYNTREGIAWIVDANSIRDPNRISINTKLVIPARSESPRREPVSEKPKTEKKIPDRYTVKSGDGDLFAICRRFYGATGQGARVAEIMRLNNLFSAEVEVGSEIRLVPR